MKEFYTYSETSIITIDLPSYKKFQSRLPHNKKVKRTKTTNTFYYFFQLYLNSLVYFYPNHSEKELFTITNIILKENINIIEYDILIKMFKTAKNNLKLNKEDQKFYTSPKNFIWDNKGLKDYFNNDKEQIRLYKYSIISKYNKLKSLKEKENTIKSYIEEYINQGKYKSQIIKYLLNKKFDKDYIYKVIKEYDLKERNNTFILLDDIFKKLFNQDIKEKLTNENIIDFINNTNIWDEITEKFIKLDIKKDTYYRYLKETHEIKEKIKKFNENLKKEKEFMEKKEVKEEVYNEEWTKKDEFELLNKISNINSIDFLDDDEFLEKEIAEKNKKIITMKEAEEIENRKAEEWTAADDDYFNKKKVKYA